MLKFLRILRLATILLLMATLQVLAGTNTMLQPRTITGTVVDSDGVPLPGVNIVIKGTSIGTITDAEGNYSLSDVPDDAIMVLTYIGMMSQEVPVGDQTTINLTMEPDFLGLEEVVVTGYGTQKKVNLTGSIDVVEGDRLENRAVGSVSQALQGISPNLTITATDFGAEPGAEMQWQLRGSGTLTGSGGTPYILVDGVPMDINSLNPDDIESVSILKDAASSAIYGARAPYGVILITTKSGKGAQEGTVSIDYSNNIAFTQIAIVPDLPDVDDFLDYQNRMKYNTDGGVAFTDERAQRIRDWTNGVITDETYATDDITAEPSGWATEDANGYHNWFDKLYKQWAPRQKHDFKIYGNSRNTTYYLSAGFYNSGSQWEGTPDMYKRNNLTANINSKITDWLSVNFRSKISSSTKEASVGMSDYERGVNYLTLIQRTPTNIWKTPDGVIRSGNYLMMTEGGTQKTQINDTWITLGAVLEPIKGWKTTLNYNVNLNMVDYDEHKKAYYQTGRLGNTWEMLHSTPSVDKYMRKTNYEMINVVSAFDRTFGDHNLGILVGFEQEVWENRILEGYREFQITDQDAIKMGTGAFTTGDQMAHWATRGFFGRLTYNYKSKYLFEANARYDGSSRFAQGEEQWGLFPSASVGYVISNEAFWESINPYVNYLKVRASYGSLGNQGVPNYLYLPIMEIVSQTNWIEGGIRDPYVLAPTLISNTLSWETAVTMNLGFDLAFLRNRLTATMDLYNRVTKDMFGPSEAVPEVLGADVPQINNAELSTSGIDLVLGWRDKIGSDFGYGVRLTFGDYQSTVTKYNNPTGTLATWREGQKLGEIWGYTVEGLFQSDDEVAGHADQSYVFQNWSPGDVKLKDLNGDEVIDIGETLKVTPET